jgi:hypothetical protein
LDYAIVREDRSSEQLCQADYGAFLVLCEIKFMSRRPRIHFPEAVYHVISPGAGGEKIPNNQSLHLASEVFCLALRNFGIFEDLSSHFPLLGGETPTRQVRRLGLKKDESQ